MTQPTIHPDDRRQAAETQATDAERLLKGPVAVRFGKQGVEIEDLDQMYRYAVSVHRSKLAPKGLTTPEAIMLAIQMGAELGMRPMTAIQNIAVINGRPSIWGDAALAVCRMSKLFDEEAFLETIVEEEAPTPGWFAICEARRIGGKPIIRRFSMADAKTASLLGKDNWKNYPRRMLQMRARSWALRDCFPDVLLGMRLTEEQMDCPDERPTDHTQSHIEQAKKMGADRDLPIEDMSPADAARVFVPLSTDPDPPANPPTPEEVARAQWEISHPVLEDTEEQTEKQAAAWAELTQRIDAATRVDHIDIIEDDAADSVTRGLIFPAGAVELSRRIAEARGRVKG